MRTPKTIVLALVLAAAAVAHADDKAVARQAYTEGTRLYDLADFNGALEAFKKAYLNYEEPTFLFNIAQCYRQLGNKPEAIRFYKTYLRKQTNAPNADEVRRLIDKLEAPTGPPPPPATEKPPPAKPPVAAAPPPPAPTLAPPPPTPAPSAAITSTPAGVTREAAPRRPVYKKWWFWTVTVVGAAAVATAVGVGVTLGQPRETSFQVHAP